MKQLKPSPPSSKPRLKANPLAKVLPLMDVPAGWEATMASDQILHKDHIQDWHGKTYPNIVFLQLTGEGIEILITAPTKHRTQWDGMAEGHVWFTTSNGIRTFDRIGIESSFYLSYDEELVAANALIQEQIRRVQESRTRVANSTPVPGLPGSWSVTPQKKAEITTRLLKPGYYDFLPSGMGTGYRVSARKEAHWSHQLPLETARFFDVPGPLYFTTIDHD